MWYYWSHLIKSGTHFFKICVLEALPPGKTYIQFSILHFFLITLNFIKFNFHGDGIFYIDSNNPEIIIGLCWKLVTYLWVGKLCQKYKGLLSHHHIWNKNYFLSYRWQLNLLCNKCCISKLCGMKTNSTCYHFSWSVFWRKVDEYCWSSIEPVVCLMNTTHDYLQKTNIQQVLYYFNSTHQPFFKILINWTWYHVELVFIPHNLDIQHLLHSKFSCHL